MINKLRVNWHQSINFGDQLNPYIIKHFFGSYVPKSDINDQPHIMLLGSILNEADRNTVVMGAGFVSDNSQCKNKPIFLSLRGKLTLERVYNLYNPSNFNSIKLGDPGIIIPKIYDPNINVNKKIGIIPHWVDMEIACSIFKKIDDTQIIDVRCERINQIEDVINKMKECEVLISSSLHGVIIAHSYNIPCLWVEFSDLVIGGGFKFRDYFSAHIKDTNHYHNYNPVNLRKGLGKYNIDDIYSLAKNSIIDLTNEKNNMYSFYENNFKKWKK